LVECSDADIIPKSIDFVFTKWIADRGTFNRDNFEKQPCFVLQNDKERLSEKLTRLNVIYSVRLPSNIVVNVSLDQSGGTWFEKFEWTESERSFILDSSNGQFHCKINLYKPLDQLGQCTAI